MGKKKQGGRDLYDTKNCCYDAMEEEQKEQKEEKKRGKEEERRQQQHNNRRRREKGISSGRHLFFGAIVFLGGLRIHMRLCDLAFSSSSTCWPSLTLTHSSVYRLLLCHCYAYTLAHTLRHEQNHIV